MAVSDRVPGGTGDGPAPYFFLSYARHHRSGEDKAEQAPDPDRWTLRFFDDLTYEVTELTTLPGGARPGFMDRDIHVGQQWQRRISEALAACRVFVPLYTPRYFTSLNCASEWYLFQARQSAHELTSGARPEAIVPVLWLPIPDTELPPAARALQFDHHTLGEVYARLGFLQLIRLARYKDEYQLAIHALARHVVKVAREGAPRAARPVDFTTLRGRFETADGLFEAAGELVRRAGVRTPLSLPPTGRGRLALPPGTGELRKLPGPPAPKSVAKAAADTDDTDDHLPGPPSTAAKDGAGSKADPGDSGADSITSLSGHDQGPAAPITSLDGSTGLGDLARSRPWPGGQDQAPAAPSTGPALAAGAAETGGDPSADPATRATNSTGSTGSISSTSSISSTAPTAVGSGSGSRTQPSGPSRTPPAPTPDSGLSAHSSSGSSGTGSTWRPSDPSRTPLAASDSGPDLVDPAEAAVAAYLRVVGSKLAEWFSRHPAQVSSGDFDEFYFRAVHPAAKAALLRQLTPHADGPFPRPPRLRGDGTDPPVGGARHGT